MKQKVISTMLLLSMGATLLAGCGSTAGNGTEGGAGASNAEEGKVINIYSWNDEFRTRVEAVYPEVKETSKDGTITYLKDGTEIHWVVNPNQDGVYPCLSLFLLANSISYHIFLVLRYAGSCKKSCRAVFLFNNI